MEPAESDNSSHYELVPKTPPVFLVILLLLWQIPNSVYPISKQKKSRNSYSSGTSTVYIMKLILFLESSKDKSTQTIQFWTKWSKKVKYFVSYYILQKLRIIQLIYMYIIYIYKQSPVDKDSQLRNLRKDLGEVRMALSDTQVYI